MAGGSGAYELEESVRGTGPRRQVSPLAEQAGPPQARSCVHAGVPSEPVRRFDKISPLLAALVAAVAWWGLGTVRRLPVLEATTPMGTFDFVAYYRPNAQYAFSRLAAGEIPLWNPLQGFGLPFLATLQTGVLYPPNWLHLFLPTQLAFAILAAAHLGLAAVFCAALARALGANGWGSLAAGLLFAGSNWLFGAVFSPPMLYSVAWLPAVILAVERIVERPGPGRVAALAGAVAMQALTGWPYVLVMTALAAAVFSAGALVEVGLRERRLPISRAVALTAGAIAGALLAAPQILPAEELLSHSARAIGILDSDQTVLLTMQHDPAYFLTALLRNGVNDAVPGILALPLAALALLRRSPHRARLALLLGIGVMGMLIAFPLHAPLYGWLRELPLFGDFRFPFRYRLLSTLALSIAAGVGVTQAAALVARSARVQAALAASLAALVVALQSSVVFRGTYPFPREATFPRTPGVDVVLARLRDGIGTGRIHWQHADEFAWIDKIGQMEGLRVTHDLEPLTPAAVARYLSFFETGTTQTIDARDILRDRNARTSSKTAAPRSFMGSIPFFGRVGLPGEAARSRLLDLASVRFVLANEPPAWLDQRFVRLRDLGAHPAVFENPNALPRAYRVRFAESEPSDPGLALARLVAPEFDARETVLLDDPPAGLTRSSAAVTATGAGAASLEVDEPNRQVIRTHGDESGVVVVTDTFYPGWEATLDGEPVPILRANTVFRAVAVPAGEHVVEMRYRPRMFRLGVALSLGTLLAGSAFALWLAWSPRRSAPS